MGVASGLEAVEIASRDRSGRQPARGVGALADEAESNFNLDALRSFAAAAGPNSLPARWPAHKILSDWTTAFAPCAEAHVSPELLRRLQLSWNATLDLKFVEAHSHVAAVEWGIAELPAEQARHLHAELDLIQGAAYALRDEASASLAISGRWLEEPGRRGAIATTLCRFGYWRRRDFAGLRRLPIAKVPQEGARSHPWSAVVDLSIEAAVAFEELRFPIAKRLAWEALFASEKAFGRDSVAAAIAAAVAAHLALEEGRLEEAERLASERLSCLRTRGDPEAAIYIYDVLARVAAAQGRYEMALRVLDDAVALGERRGTLRLAAACILTRLELMLGQDQAREAELCVARLDRLASASVAGDPVVRADLRRYAVAGRAEYERAVQPGRPLAAVFNHLRSEALGRRDFRQAIRHSLSLIDVLSKIGERDEALSMLAEVVAAGVSAGLSQTIVRGGATIHALLADLLEQETEVEIHLYIQTLLASIGPDAAARDRDRRAARNLSPVSEREEAILRLISDGLANKRIAQALNISPETVKSHIKSIFAKLSVATRGEAVRRARTLGLI